MQLFCFPYAGSSAMVYNKWKKIAHSSLEIVPVELPGRGTRFGDELCHDMEKLIDDLYGRIEHRLSQDDYMIFGHSMGSWIVFNLVNKILREGKRKPAHVYVAGKEAPHINKGEPTVHDLPHEDFIKKVTSLGGTPIELLEDPEVREVFLPILRNDYKLIETCRFQEPSRPYPCSITVFNGVNDELNAEDLNGWGVYTESDFHIYNFDGGHFFIHDYAKEMLEIIRDDILKGRARELQADERVVH